MQCSTYIQEIRNSLPRKPAHQDPCTFHNCPNCSLVKQYIVITNMLSTFVLFLALAALTVIASIVFAWGMFFAIFTQRPMYGVKTLACGILGGIGGVLLILALCVAVCPSDCALPFRILLMVLETGFCIAGGTCAVLGLLSPLFSYNNRWSARKRVANKSYPVRECQVSG